MKIFFIFICFLFLNAPQHSLGQSLNKNNYSLNIKKFKEEKMRGETYWLIECNLKNNSKDTLRYLSMSCSWQDFYTLNKKELEIEEAVCDKNVPIILELAPQETRQEILRLYLNKESVSSSPGQFKVGLNFIESQSTHYFFEKIKKKNIIWSNAITL